jgi:peptidoglycan/xylan/chitin deacetylase (PgdA/CDA1 family)
MTDRHWEWPDGARVAVNFNLVLEQWSTTAVEPGGRMTPSFPKELLDQGRKDWAAITWQDYGGRTGFARLMDVLDEYHVQGTASISGLAADTWPDVVRRFVEAGHEPAGHAYDQATRMYMLSPDEERAEIRRCVETLRRCTGERPVGWGSPGGQRSDLTPQLLLEEGFVWESDFRDSDAPYVALERDGRRLVAMPNTFEINDLRLLGRHGQGPGVYVELFCRSLDRLYKEGQRSPKVLTAVLHSTHFGRPFGGWALEACIQYAKQFPLVWIARKGDIARWYLEQGAPAAD